MSIKVLVVDDDPSIVHMLSENLEQEGYQVLKGYDGQMAIQLAKSQMPHLIILDVNMPMTSGIKALEAIRNLPATQSIPVLLLTGEASSAVFPIVESLQRVAHIKKPVDLENLNSLVREFLQKYPPAL